ncbi:MAG: lipopolysaccharide biosynthesis protein [Planctomycetota bacterium]
MRRRLAGLIGSRFLRESTTLQGASFATAASNLLGSVILTHVLGATQLGVFYTAMSAFSLLWALLNLGLPAVVTAEVARALQSGRTADVTRWLGALAWLTPATALVAALLGWFALAPLCVLAYRALGTEIGPLAAWMCLLPLIDAPRIVLSTALQSTRRMASLARIDLGQELVRVVLVSVGALVTGNAYGPLVGTLLASVGGSVLALDLYRQARRDGAPLPPLRDVLRAREAPLGRALQEGVKVGFVRNVDALGVQILPSLILPIFAHVAWVSYLRIAQRIVAMARLVMQGINRTALPALSALAGVKDVQGLRRMYWRASLLSGATISLGIIVALPFLPFLIRGLFPEDFHGPVWRIVLILVPGVMVVSFSVANDVFYLVTRQMRVAIWLSLLGLIVNTAQITLFAWWLPTIGVAIGLSVTCLWSLVHVAYAWRWFRTHAGPLDRAPRDSGTSQAAAGPAAPPAERGA